MHGWKGAVATFDLCSRPPFREDVWEQCYGNPDFLDILGNLWMDLLEGVLVCQCSARNFQVQSRAGS